MQAERDVHDDLTRPNVAVTPEQSELPPGKLRELEDNVEFF